MQTTPSWIRRIAVLALTIALSAHDAMACSCGAANICELVENAGVIFLGEVVEGGLDPGEDAWSGRPTFARLRIIEAFKGVPLDVREVTVELAYLKGMCSPAVYRRGERTLAFLAKPGNNESLRDGACSGSRFEKGDSPDLQYVRDHFAGRTSPTIRGHIAANYPASMVSYILDSEDGTAVEGAEVTAQGIGRKFSVKSDRRGEYVLSGIPVGKYRVSAQKAGYTNKDPDESEAPASFDVEVSARGCAIQNLGLWANNSLKGIVSDASGKPVPGLWLSLQKVSNNEDHGEEERTDERGEFEFKHIDSGKHYLSVNPFGPSADSPYETRYYGGAATREQARTIQIESTSHFSAMNIYLDRKIATREARIRLEWPDGTPVSTGFFLCGDARIQERNTRYFSAADKRPDGTFVCKTLVDRPYRIWTSFVDGRPTKDTPDVVIPAGDQATEVRIQAGPQDAAARK
jgi:hypothetical protein